MKKSIKNLTIILTIAFNMLTVQSYGQSKELKFRDVLNKDKISVVDNKMKFSIAIDTVQKTSDRGIKFSIKIKNDSSINITIQNVLDRIYLSLKNDSGRNVLVSQQSRSKINHHQLFKYTSYIIDDVSINGKSIGTDSLDRKEFITIPANKTYIISLRIPRIVKEKSKTAFGSDLIISTPKGKYTLAADIAITTDKLTLITIPPIVIKYGVSN
jgi:hypothetical protein